jgi:epsilon-lactone hydrolase
MSEIEDARVDEDGTIHLGPRTIPPPQWISEEARGVIARPRGFAEPPPRLDDIDAWRQLVAKVNASSQPSIDRALARSEGKATVETLTLDGVTVHLGTPTSVGEANRDRAWLAVHGGGFFYLAGPWPRAEAALTAAEWGCTTYGVDYRVPPDHPFPAGVDDVVAVYRHLLGRYEPRNIVVFGTSAGGNIACSAILKARDAGLPLPGALILDTPLSDLAGSGDTTHTLRYIDARAPLPAPGSRVVERSEDPMLLYTQGRDVTDPLLSPVFADFSLGFPPTYIQSGTRDVFLSSCVRLHRALRNAGCEAELHVWEGAPHSAFFLSGAPEEAEAHAERARFLAKYCGT